MSRSKRRNKPRALRYLLIFFLAGGCVAFVSRQPILEHVGRYLVVSDDLEKSDAIAILGGDPAGRGRKASELFFQGWAPRILITRGSYPHRVHALREYGIEELTSGEKAVSVLESLGVPRGAIEVLEGYNEGTFSEAETLVNHFKARRLESLIVVTSNYHSRRSRLLFRRVMGGGGYDVRIRPGGPRFDFDPDRWWTRRLDSKTLLQEYQKLLFYALRYW